MNDPADLACAAALGADLDAEDAFDLDLGAYQGPLHVLLALAKDRKIDLREVSMIDLADQFLAFVDTARAARLELSADYLVMAAWLTYLKSRLLLPKPEEDVDEPDPQALAAGLAFRLIRLSAMRDAIAALDARPALGRDVFARGGAGALIADQPAPPPRTAALFDLLNAYGACRSKRARARVTFPRAPVYALEEAREALAAAIAQHADWASLAALLPSDDRFAEPRPPRASVWASAFVAGLELTKEGRAELRQPDLFGEIYVRARSARGAARRP